MLKIDGYKVTNYRNLPNQYNRLYPYTDIDMFMIGQSKSNTINIFKILVDSLNSYQAQAEYLKSERSLVTEDFTKLIELNKNLEKTKISNVFENILDFSKDKGTVNFEYTFFLEIADVTYYIKYDLGVFVDRINTKVEIQNESLIFTNLKTNKKSTFYDNKKGKLFLSKFIFKQADLRSDIQEYYKEFGKKHTFLSFIYGILQEYTYKYINNSIDNKFLCFYDQLHTIEYLTEDKTNISNISLDRYIAVTKKVDKNFINKQIKDRYARELTKYLTNIYEEEISVEYEETDQGYEMYVYNSQRVAIPYHYLSESMQKIINYYSYFKAMNEEKHIVFIDNFNRGISKERCKKLFNYLKSGYNDRLFVAMDVND